MLRHWVKAQEVQTVQAHSHIVREIVPVPGIGYLTCSNDETIKLWSKELDLLSTFLGHQGFVFGIRAFNIGAA